LKKINLLISFLTINLKPNSTFQKLRKTQETNHKGGEDYGLKRARLPFSRLRIQKFNSFISSSLLANLHSRHKITAKIVKR